MKKYLIILLIFNICSAQTINIPDAHFKAMLLAANSTNTIAATGPLNNLTNVKIDTNNDGEIQVSEAQVINYLLIINSQISDLTGIEYFTNLNWFNCAQNNLTTLDVSHLIQLNWLFCYQNNIASLNLTSLFHLKQLFCFQNNITSLDFSHNPELTTVYCGNNQISSLDFSANPLFNDLGCRNNQLTSLNIKNGTSQLFGAQTYLNECWTGNPNLTTICADDAGTPALQNFMSACGVNTSGMVINSSCSMANDEFMADGVGVYPNPSDGVFMLYFNQAVANDCNLVVYDVLGRGILEKQVNKNSTEYDLDLTHFASGNYIVKLTNSTNGVCYYKKIIKL